MKLYCDLDGVLCNFNGRFEEFVGVHPDKFLEKYNIRAFWKEIEKHGINWWSHMEWKHDGKDLWNFIINNFDDVEILTGSPWGVVGQNAHKGKELWVARELGKYVVNHKSGSRKWEFANENTILVDDTPKVIEKWINNGKGIGILHTNTEDTIKQLKKYL